MIKSFYNQHTTHTSSVTFHMFILMLPTSLVMGPLGISDSPRAFLLSVYSIFSSPIFVTDIYPLLECCILAQIYIRISECRDDHSNSMFHLW